LIDANTLKSLRYQDDTITRARGAMYLLTERRTSIAVKITPTGGYAFENKYQMADRVQIDR
jgi:hypothetical protein